MHTLKVVPEVTPMSSFHDLTKFLIFSFTEKKRKEVEEILVKREKGLLDEVAEFKLHFQKVKEDRDNLKKKLELCRENSDKAMKQEKHKLQERERRFHEKNIGLEHKMGALEEKNGDLECKIEVLEKKWREVERVLVKREKCLLDEVEEIKLHLQKLKKELSLSETKNSELDEKVRRYKEKNRDLEYQMEVLEDKNGDLKYKIEVLEVKSEELQNKVDELGVENGKFENKIGVLEVKNEELQNKVDELGVENGKFENKIGVLEVKNEELQNKVDELGVENGEFENKLGVLEVKNEELQNKVDELGVKNKELQNKVDELGVKNEVLQNKVSELRVKNKELQNKVDELGVENGKFVNKIALLEVKNEELDNFVDELGVENGNFVDSNWKSCHTKSQATFENPSSETPPQVESIGAEEIIVGAKLGVTYMIEYEPEGGGCSENNIKFKRKRSIDGSDDDNDSLLYDKKTKSLLESGCKKISLGVPKANIPPKFSSTSTKKYEDKNGSHENSESHLTRSISGSVDEINRSARGDPHVASVKNKVVAGFQSGKGIRWKYLGDMFSAFEEDDELCMNAVCALYRQNISAMVSKDGSGFSSIDLVRGSDVAEYLINGDTENKLRRSAEEVRQDRPDIIESCKRLVVRNGVQLFKIYHNKLDPFWPNSSILDNWF